MAIKRLNFRDCIFFFCFSVFLITQLFNGVYKYFVPFTIQFSIDFLCFILIFCTHRVYLIKISRKQIYYWLFIEMLTLIMLCFYFWNHHYDYNKILSNCIVAHFYLFYYLTYLLIVNRYKFNNYLKKILIYTIFFEIVLFFIYYMFIGSAMMNLFLRHFIPDSRFQGTFSEPCFLGFYIGIFALLNVYVFRTKISCCISFFLIFVLFLFCRAKFAVIAFPVAIVFSLLLVKIKFSDTVFNFLFFYFIVCGLIIVLQFDELLHFFVKVLNKITPGDKNSFITRFSFIFASLENVVKFPFGNGIGLNYEYFYEPFKKYYNIYTSFGFNNSEILGYIKNTMNPKNFYPKETFSYLLSSFGLYGLYFYFYTFHRQIRKIQTMNDKFFFKLCLCAMLLFVFFESLLTINVFAQVAFPFFLVALSACNFVPDSRR